MYGLVDSLNLLLISQGNNLILLILKPGFTLIILEWGLIIRKLTCILRLWSWIVLLIIIYKGISLRLWLWIVWLIIIYKGISLRLWLWIVWLIIIYKGISLRLWLWILIVRNMSKITLISFCTSAFLEKGTRFFWFLIFNILHILFYLKYFS